MGTPVSNGRTPTDTELWFSKPQLQLPLVQVLLSLSFESNLGTSEEVCGGTGQVHL